jgi:hypothetical protein
MIAPLAKFLDWSVIQLMTLMAPIDDLGWKTARSSAPGYKAGEDGPWSLKEGINSAESPVIRGRSILANRVQFLICVFVLIAASGLAAGTNDAVVKDSNSKAVKDVAETKADATTERGDFIRPQAGTLAPPNSPTTAAGIGAGWVNQGEEGPASVRPGLRQVSVGEEAQRK